jgi:hypothetical protein
MLKITARFISRSFQNAEPDPVSYPTHVSSAALSGITRASGKSLAAVV